VRHRRRGIIPVLAIVLAAALGLGAGCARDEEPVELPSVLGGAKEPPDQELFDYTLTETEQGEKRWVLASRRMERYLSQEDVQLFDVHMQFYRDGRIHSTLTSLRGTANLQTKKLFAYGNVVVVTEDGRRLETDELHYDNQRELIWNEVFNRFTRDDDVMTGYGMEATPSLDYFELKEEVRATVADREDKQPEGTHDEPSP